MALDLRKKVEPTLIDQKMTKSSDLVPNPFETHKGGDMPSPEKDMIPERDPEFENDDFNKLYHEHLRRKEQIRQRIEQMTREKNFLEQLKPQEVAYMFQKKNEHALNEENTAFENEHSPQKAKRELSKSPSRQKLARADSSKQIVHKVSTVDLKDLSTEEKHKLMKQREEFKQIKQAQVQMRTAITKQYLAPVEAESAIKLKDKVNNIRRENPLRADNKKYDLKKIGEDFQHNLKDFQANMYMSEEIRLQADAQLQEMSELSYYLMDETKTNRDKLTGNLKFTTKITDIKVVSDIVGSVDQNEWEQSRLYHEEKLEKFRRQKKYESYLCDDEEDVEGEKILSDIRNLNSEKFFNRYFSVTEEYDQQVSKEQQKSQMNLGSTLKWKNMK